MRIDCRAFVRALVSLAVVVSFVVVGASACSSSNGSSSGSSAEGGSGTSGGVTFSCTVAGVDCIQMLALSSEIPAENTTCTQETMGTFTMGACPVAPYAGCCTKNGPNQEVDCFFAGPTVSLFQSECTKAGGEWVANEGGGEGGTSADEGGPPQGDAGATGASAFVGTWARSGTQTTMCPGGTTTTAVTGNLVITLGSGSGTIVAKQPDGCVTDYTVSGNVASAAAGQMCSTTTEAGVAETITVMSHTLTLSADGTTLDSTGSESLDKTATGTMCTIMSSGTYTKVSS
jgi:hypothetical protein